jgi:ABC-type iron transport system FetAB permease component
VKEFGFSTTRARQILHGKAVSSGDPFLKGCKFERALYFNKFVLDLGSLLEARYLIPIGGMFLGNALSGNVVGIEVL